MANGYAGKLLEVNLSRDKISETVISERILKQYVGGRGLAAKILWDRLGKRWSTIDPLGPRNILLALTGPLTGFIGGGRTCISGKSPASNGIAGSTIAGEFPIELKCAGYDGIIVSGKAKKPVYILVTDGKAEIRDAKKLWGLDGKQTLKEINHEVNDLLEKREPLFGLWKDAGVLYIGPAGEKLCRASAVISKWAHGAGYGGYGALMGSKKLKAIVAKGTGPLPDVADPKAAQALLEREYAAARDSWQMRVWGTGAGGFRTGNVPSSEPQRNWQEEYHNMRSIGVPNYETTIWVKRYWSDYGCPVACEKLSCVTNGPLKGAITDNPDYEAMAYCGTNLGVYDPEGNTYITSVVEDMGFSSINGANIMGFAAELFQRGILTKEDLGGIEPKWGDAKAMGELAKLIAHRRKIGKVLAEGTYRAAVEISKIKGIDCMPYAVQFKGIEVGAHGMRSGLGFGAPMGIGYALGTQGGDHTSQAKPPFGEADVTLGDTMVFCTIGTRITRQEVWDFYKAVTGWTITNDEWLNTYGRRIVQIQRAAILIGGPDITWDAARDDDNPQRWYQPLPTGPKAGSAPTHAEFLEARKKAYEAFGWDEKGIPTTAELKRLGLEDVDKALAPLRK
ncbi:MAG: aldehyde:ferredoxin oxidoreductase [Thermoproteota archaeon]|nr:aldehyde:ferredoxin oxidoreductase [Thermoproteota archaeon]